MLFAILPSIIVSTSALNFVALPNTVSKQPITWPCTGTSDGYGCKFTSDPANPDFETYPYYSAHWLTLAVQDAELMSNCDVDFCEDDESTCEVCQGVFEVSVDSASDDPFEVSVEAPAGKTIKVYQTPLGSGQTYFHFSAVFITESSTTCSTFFTSSNVGWKVSPSLIISYYIITL